MDNLNFNLCNDCITRIQELQKNAQKKVIEKLIEKVKEQENLSNVEINKYDGQTGIGKFYTNDRRPYVWIPVIYNERKFWISFFFPKLMKKVVIHIPN